MVVDDPDIVGSSVMPSKADPPLLVDPNAVLAASITLWRFEPVARRPAQIAQRPRLIQHAKLAQSDGLNLEGQSPTAPTVPDAGRLGVGKALDHEVIVTARSP
jgi:hypothetical protein